MIGTASIQPHSANRKLSPVKMVPYDGPPGTPKFRPVPTGPFVVTTYTSIEATCPTSCVFKGAGCYADAGFTKRAGQAMDKRARRAKPEDVIAEEVRLIDGLWSKKRGNRWPGRVPQDGPRGGRDLRLHVGGDCGNTGGARQLAGAARRWKDRGGGSVWTFTHHWRTVPRSAWGDISVLASVESVKDIKAARKRGYPAAIVVAEHPSDQAYWKGQEKIIPCPAETRGATCSSCRLCLDRDLLAMGASIGFAIHGADAAKALVQIGKRQ